MYARPLACLALVVSLTACASSGPQLVTDPSQPRAVGEGSAVNVHWADPAGFSELRYSQNRHEAARGDWVVELADYMQEKIAKTVPPGDRVDVEIVDITRAGEYEWLSRATSDDIRVLRDVYPPRMTLNFRHVDASGNVVGEGERKIADLAYLQTTPAFPTSDPLRYDKRLIDTWVRREFKR
jgi:hypothetical protein